MGIIIVCLTCGYEEDLSLRKGMSVESVECPICRRTLIYRLEFQDKNRLEDDASSFLIERKEG